MGKVRDIAQKAVALDLFAPPVRLTYKNRTVFKTKLGALFSVLMMTGVMIYAFSTLGKIVNGTVDTVTMNELFKPSWEPTYFAPGTLGFDFGVGILGTQIPEQIATIKVEHVTQTWES